MKTTAIIPARGGSKGIPKKNLLNLCGYPLISYAIRASTRSAYISRTIVSTDDDEISSIAIKYGAEVITRPADISGDESSSESALLHVLQTLTDHGETVPDIIVFLQCTSPLTQPEDIDAAIDELISNDADSCLSVTPSHSFLWRIKQENQADGINHDPGYRPRRQEMEPQYRENGAIYVMRTEGFMKTGHRFFGKTVLSVMPPERSWEIDEPFDVLVIEQLLNQQNLDQLISKISFPIGAIIFDFDGVFTDNMVYVNQDGSETVRCHRGDGMGIERLKKLNIPMIVVSKEKNPVVSARCKKLGLECFHAIEKKEVFIEQWMEEKGINPYDVIYVGNDLNDLASMKMVGCPVAVGDAIPEVKRIAKIVLTRNGGKGAIRELSDLICKKGMSKDNPWISNNI
ncbi:acylneuraminate cytidylyltransferase [Methanospirillum sp.]|jgi:N-acylneuraminate cytidylyltransferase|uniref:acylneuraminate cytidylyltransferase n=1 Tax=Methanospirillum sp. TaxID=45200 RepID=UPI001BD3E755|nr:acylneuraminate cytidylyltransferase [Methanospirillum sp.]